MYIKNLSLINFRNYGNEYFEFSKGLNLITGKNAQGKTNAVEAVYYLCTGYSPRAVRDKEIVMWDKEKATIRGVAVTSYGEVEVTIDIFKNSKKDIKINGVKILKAGELLGNINSVFFNPQELKIVQESPEDRRRFMDLALSQLSKNYYYSLLRYKKILTQRNNLLKNENENIILDTLPIWDEHLALYGSKIIKTRAEFLDKLKPLAKSAHLYITNDDEKLDISSDCKYISNDCKYISSDYKNISSDYKNNSSDCKNDSSDYKYDGEEEIKNEFLAALKESYSKDIRLGYTTVGPHRDDMKITSNGIDLKVYGSQGQKRTAALSIKLAEMEFFLNRTGEYPILILDDVLSELDFNRKTRLLQRLNGIQTLLTLTEIEDEVFKNRDYKSIEIKSGKIDNIK